MAKPSRPHSVLICTRTLVAKTRLTLLILPALSIERPVRVRGSEARTWRLGRSYATLCEGLHIMKKFLSQFYSADTVQISLNSSTRRTWQESAAQG